MLSRINAQLSAFYDLRAAEEPSRDPEANLRFRKAIAAAALASNERILDIGAKWGGLAASVKAAGLSVEYVGFDLSEVNADSAREAVECEDRASKVLDVDGAAVGDRGRREDAREARLRGKAEAPAHAKPADVCCGDRRASDSACRGEIAVRQGPRAVGRARSTATEENSRSAGSGERGDAPCPRRSGSHGVSAGR